MSKITDEDFENLILLVSHCAFHEIMPHFRRLGDDAISSKTNAADLVTIADVAAEKFLTKELRAYFPYATIIGEEAVSDDPSILSKHDWEGLTFTLDPIDGTFNFASGVPIFGTMLSIVQNGETIGGIIYDPVMDDTIFARKGEGGVYKSANGHRVKLKVAEPASFDQMTGSVSWSGFDTDMRKRLTGNQTRNLNFFAYRCAAHDYRILSTGMAHYVLYGRMMPWDHLAGTLIFQEAGGYSARFDNSEYRPAMTDGGLLHAPTKDMWEDIRNELWK